MYVNEISIYVLVKCITWYPTEVSLVFKRHKRCIQDVYSTSDEHGEWVYVMHSAFSFACLGTLKYFRKLTRIFHSHNDFRVLNVCLSLYSRSGSL